MNTETKETARVNIFSVLETLKREILAIEDSTNPDAIDDYWNEVFEQLETIRSQQGKDELRPLETIIELLVELRSTCEAEGEKYNRHSPDR